MSQAKALSVVVGLLFARPASAVTEPDWRDPPERALTFEERRDAGRLSVEELRAKLPGMVAADDLPAVRVIPGAGFHFPYQLIGLHLGVELVPIRFLRASAFYSLGLAAADGNPVLSHYAEGFVGLRVLGAASESRTEIPLREPRTMSFAAPPALKTWVPSYHALFIEGGVVTAFIALRPCVQGCPRDAPRPPSDRMQLVFAAVGPRYTYYSDVRSDRLGLRSRVLFQLYAHLFSKPFNQPSEPRYFPNGNEAGPGGLGGRVGAEIPPFGRCLASFLHGLTCATANVALGYAPYPRFLWFELGITFPAY